MVKNSNGSDKLDIYKVRILVGWGGLSTRQKKKKSEKGSFNKKGCERVSFNLGQG